MEQTPPASSRESAAPPPSASAESPPSAPLPVPEWPEVLDWVRENQTLAMLGAFAVGVFVGVMMRD